MRCKLGTKKHRRCEEIAGRKFTDCLTRGGQPHFWAICVWYNEKNPEEQFCLYVNYKTREVKKNPPRVPGYAWI